MKKCNLCPATADRGERYCRRCQPHVLAELRKTGYLTRIPWTCPRHPSAREKTHETKFGVN